MLAMPSVIVENVFYLLCNFLYSTGGGPQSSQGPGNFTPYSPSRRAWVR